MGNMKGSGAEKKRGKQPSKLASPLGEKQGLRRNAQKESLKDRGLAGRHVRRNRIGVRKKVREAGLKLTKKGVR